MSIGAGATASNLGRNHMFAANEIPVLDHELAGDELGWIDAVQQDFADAVSASGGALNGSELKEILRQVLGNERHRLSTPMALTGAGPWVGRNGHDRLVAAVFLSGVELHRHSKSRTDQFVVYVTGRSEAFSLNEGGEAVLTPCESGSHFHNPPDSPHAFLPAAGADVPADWQIAFLAITPRNLREDTQAVSEEVRAAYERVAGREAPREV